MKPCFDVDAASPQYQPETTFGVTLLFCVGATWATPMNRDLETFGIKPFGHGQPMGFFRQLNVKYSLAGVAIKMTMFCHIGTKMRRAPVQSDLPDQSAFDQSIQTVINGGHRNIRHLIFGPDKNLLGRGMIALIHQNRVNVLALRREAKTAACQPIIQICFRSFSCCSHSTRTLPESRSDDNTWNNSN